MTAPYGGIDINQGDLFWIDIPPSHVEGSEQHGRRPFVVMSRLMINRRVNTVVAVPLTTYEDQTKFQSWVAKQSPFRIVIPVAEITRDIGCASQLYNCVAKTDQVRVVDKSRLEQKIGRLSQTATLSIGLGLAYIFDIR